jgi:hypothetical protein
MVENGFIGLTLYLGLWFVIFKRALRIIFHGDQIDDNVSILIAVGLTVYGGVINVFLGGGALNKLFLVFPAGVVIGLTRQAGS